MEIKGLTIGDPVESGRLTAWPLYGQDYHGYGFVDEVQLVHDHSYGRMGFKGGDDPDGGIAPAGMMFFIPTGQDRALRESVFIPYGETVYVDTVCLEPSNGGLWQPGEGMTTRALPISLQAALPDGRGFSDLWPDIRERHAANGQTGTTVHALLKPGQYVLSKDMIDPDARGAMLAIDGRVVAIEIAPTKRAFRQWWVEYGLSEAFAFEAQTLPELPLPIGQVAGGTIEPEAQGMHKVTVLDILKGWVYAMSGQIIYASLLEKEGLTVFKKHGQERARPDYQAEPDTPCDGDGEPLEWVD